MPENVDLILASSGSETPAVEIVRPGEGVSLLVEVHGEKYWLLNGLDEDGPLAYLSSCDENGKLDWHAAFDDDSFAHWFPEDDAIMRYRERIGGRDDIKLLLVGRDTPHGADLPKEAK